jgi:hypothetical protein
MKKALLICSLIAWLPLSPAKAGSVSLDDFDTTISLNSTPITSTISAIWGTYSSGTFTPLLSATQSAQNTGYFDGSAGEVNVSFSQIDNAAIAAGTAMFASIFNVVGGGGTSVWNSTVAQIVLSDPGWVAPTFTFSEPAASWVFSDNTVANSLTALGGASGTFNFNSGSPTVALAVPEPTTYALLAMSALALGGYLLRRRRRA